MNIIISVGSLEKGGAERVIANLSRDLADQGHSVEILLYYDRNILYTIDDRVKVTVDEKFIGKANPIKHMLWRRKYVKKSGADVFISFLAPFNMMNIAALLGLKIPIIVADRNDPRKIPQNPILRVARNILYTIADGVVLQNERNREYFSKRIKRKSKVIYNSMDIGEYQGIAQKTEKQKKIVFVGRVIKQKRPEMLVSAFATIEKEFPDYSLVFYGDGDMRGQTAEQAADLGLAGRVELAGAVGNVFECIKDAELFVLCSDFEGMPNALLEAMCMGLAVISTRVSGATDVIKDGENGLLIDCDNTEMLADAMHKMLSDDELRRTCAMNAVKISKLLDKNKITAEWLDYINIICSKHI